jgi:dihydrodipicolinate synthase/N-acetylneuraminate lyase
VLCGESKKAAKGSMYAMIKELLRRKGVSLGGVRAPFAPLLPEDLKQADLCEEMIAQAEGLYLEQTKKQHNLTESTLQYSGRFFI